MPVKDTNYVEHFKTDKIKLIKTILGENISAEEIDICMENIDIVLAWLRPRERSIVLERFSGKTLSAIGDAFNLTKGRIRQIVMKAIRKMKHPAKINLLLGKACVQTDMPTDILEVTARVANWMQRNNIMSVKDIISHSPSMLLQYKGLGRKSVEEIKELLSKMGFYLKQDIHEKWAYVDSFINNIDKNAIVGENTKVWHNTHITSEAKVGDNCTIGQNCYIAGIVGNGCKIQNNVNIFKGVTLEDDVFMGPNCTTTNVLTPRAFINRKNEFKPTLIKKGASIGAGSVIICGNIIGEYALVGAKAVVTKDVPPYALMYGTPARVHGRVNKDGVKIESME